VKLYKASRPNKYNAKKTVIDGIKFASKVEGRRYCELKMLAAGGVITNLICHPVFKMVVNGQLIGRYTADFQYLDSTGSMVVEDVKSPASKTEAYGLRKKLIKALYDIEIQEITYKRKESPHKRRGFK
jgi:hypothetical protein